MVGAVGIEIASLKLKSCNRKGVAPLPQFQLLAFVGGFQKFVCSTCSQFLGGNRRPARAAGKPLWRRKCRCDFRTSDGPNRENLGPRFDVRQQPHTSWIDKTRSRRLRTQEPVPAHAKQRRSAGDCICVLALGGMLALANLPDGC